MMIFRGEFFFFFFLNTMFSNIFFQELAGQVHSKRETQYAKRSLEAEQQMHHFQHWDTFWGRPGIT